MFTSIITQRRESLPLWFFKAREFVGSFMTTASGSTFNHGDVHCNSLYTHKRQMQDCRNACLLIEVETFFVSLDTPLKKSIVLSSKFQTYCQSSNAAKCSV